VSNTSTIPINLQCGADFWIQFAYIDANGNPITITSPKMDVRTAANSGATLLYSSSGGSPTITFTQPTASSVLFRIAASATKDLTVGQLGAWDAYAIDPNGYSVVLGLGTFASIPNVTLL
jgi:hypothetical protein